MRDDIGQLLWIGFEAETVTSALRAKLDAGAVGATILFSLLLVLIFFLSRPPGP